MTSPEAEIRERNEATVKEVIARISAGRSDDIVELMDDELVFELPYGPPGYAQFDKPTFTGMQAATFKMFSSFKLELLELHRTLDPDALIAEYQSDSVVAKSGKPYKNRYIGVFGFRDGRILTWKEFHNPEIATAALS